jgi:hypothetical protein
MDRVAKGMTESGERTGVATMQRPQKGDKFRCESCGMQIQVTASCECADDRDHFHCCGQEMQKL